MAIPQKLEHVTVHLPEGPTKSIDLQVQVSIAISLKRIADFLDDELRYDPYTHNLFDRLGRD